MSHLPIEMLQESINTGDSVNEKDQALYLR
jgi:hypothetical protein